MTKRGLLVLWLFLIGMAWPGPSARGEELHMVVSVPGPRNISYLPIDLISKIGADRQHGVVLQLLHTGGGGVALNHLMTGNADFAVAGTPAAISLRTNGGDVMVVASVDEAPLFVLMVRSELQAEVHTIADLKGRVVGVNTSSKKSKTTSQQLAETLLLHGGVSLDDVRIVPAGQSWEEQSSLMLTGTADAVMGDEPFASRLQAMGKVFFLANLAEPESVKEVVGAGFLHAAVETRAETIRNEPAKVQAMVAMVRDSLHWIATHSPEQLVELLGVEDPQEKESLLVSLKKYPRAFSRTGAFSTRQLRETELFFRNASADGNALRGWRIEEMVDDRWVGRIP